MWSETNRVLHSYFMIFFFKGCNIKPGVKRIFTLQTAAAHNFIYRHPQL